MTTKRQTAKTAKGAPTLHVVSAGDENRIAALTESLALTRSAAQLVSDGISLWAASNPAAGNVLTVIECAMGRIEGVLDSYLDTKSDAGEDAKQELSNVVCWLDGIAGICPTAIEEIDDGGAYLHAIATMCRSAGTSLDAAYRLGWRDAQ